MSQSTPPSNDGGSREQHSVPPSRGRRAAISLGSTSAVGQSAEAPTPAAGPRMPNAMGSKTANTLGSITPRNLGSSESMAGSLGRMGPSTLAASIAAAVASSSPQAPIQSVSSNIMHQTTATAKIKGASRIRNVPRSEGGRRGGILGNPAPYESSGPTPLSQVRSPPSSSPDSSRHSLSNVSNPSIATSRSPKSSVVHLSQGNISTHSVGLSSSSHSGQGNLTPPALTSSNEVVSALPPISGSVDPRSGSVRRPRALWDLIRTFVSRRFFTRLMVGAAMEQSDNFAILMQQLWSRLKAQQVRSALRSFRCHALDSLGNPDAWAGHVAEKFLTAAAAPAAEPESSTSKLAIHAVDVQEDDSGLPSRSHAGSQSSSSLEGMDLDMLSFPAAFDLAPTLDTIIAGLGAVPEGSNQPSDTLKGQQMQVGASQAALDTSTNPAIGGHSSQSTRVQEAIAAAEIAFLHAHHLTAWRILVLSLRMREPAQRLVALGVLASVIRTVTWTCPDLSTRGELARVLMHVAVADERELNRLHAIQTMGDFVMFLILRSGIPEETGLNLVTATAEGDQGPSLHTAHGPPVRIFQFLVRLLHSIQCRERDALGKPFPELNSSAMHIRLKIYLINAIGKFLKSEIETAWIRNVILLLVFTELEHIWPFYRDRAEYNAVIHVIVGVLNSVQSTESNRIYMGAMFKDHIQPLMTASEGNKKSSLQRLAVQFASLWMPIMHDNADYTACQILLDGLDKLSPGHLASNDAKHLAKRLEMHTTRAATRARILWQLLQLPGMTARLVHPPGAPAGWFATPDDPDGSVGPANMPLTDGLVLHLPLDTTESGSGSVGKAAPAINPHTIVYISRPLPPLPGVPMNATTVPPVFMDPSWATRVQSADASNTQYESRERHGQIPCLPAGFTYAPAPLPASGQTVAVSPAGRPELPTGKSYIPPRPLDPRGGMQLLGSTPKRIPYGFLGRPANVDVSSPGGENGATVSNPGAPSSAHGMSVTVGVVDENGEMIAEGCSFDRHPLLFPPTHTVVGFMGGGSTGPGAKQSAPIELLPKSEFLLNAPVVLDIVDAHMSRRVTARIIALNKNFQPVAVSDHGYLSPGARFNLHVRKRRKARRTGPGNYTRASTQRLQSMATLSEAHSSGSLVSARVSQTLLSESDKRTSATSILSRIEEDESEADWMTVQLEVEEDVSNPLEILRGGVAVVPLASGFTQDGTPYYCPPANVSPLPMGYTTDGTPYYGPTPPLRPIPAGITPQGHRFYHSGSQGGPSGATAAAAASISWDSTISLPHQFAGFDYFGEPFFVPKGCKLPTPTGFTREGVPYYDLTTILLERGILLDILDPKVNAPAPPASAWTSALNYIRGQHNGVLPLADPSWIMQWPGGMRSGIQFIREFSDLGHLRLPGMKTVLEPSALSFQSMTGVVTKPCVLKFRALRGDYTERDYFLTVEPSDVFAVDVFHVRLQGEGMVQIKVNCSPSRIKYQQVEGSLAVIDDTGRRLATCRLSALRKSFVRVTPSVLQFGWVLPNQMMSLNYSVENLCNAQISMQLRRPSNGFYMTEDVIRLQNREVKDVSVSFEPQVVGAYESKVLMEAPGGEIVTLSVAGVCGVPLAVHPESRKDSSLGPDVLARERSAFVSRVFKLLERESVLSVTERHLKEKDEQALFTSLLYAMDPVGRRLNHVKVDFGLVELRPAGVGMPPDPASSAASICLTLFNVSAEALTCSMYTTCPYISIERLVRVAPHKANAVRIDLRPRIFGEIRTVITLTCPGFSTIPCLVKGYVGCPLVICTQPSVWMPPAPVQGATRVTLPVVNLSDVPVNVHIELTSQSPKFAFDKAEETKLVEDTLATVPSRPESRAAQVAPAALSHEGKRSSNVDSVTLSRDKGLEALPPARNEVKMPGQRMLLLDFVCDPVGDSVETANVQLLIESEGLRLSTPEITLICLPLWDSLNKQDLESLTHWLVQSALVAPLPPQLAPPPLANNNPRDQLPDNMIPKIKVTAPKMISQQPFLLYNPAQIPHFIHFLMSPGFELAKQSSHVIRANPGDSMYLQCSFNSDQYLESYGFITGYPEKAKPISVPMVTCPLLCVFPLPSPAAREVLIDFGTLESGTPKTSPWCIRSILLANTRTGTNALWTCRVVQIKGRHTPFEVLTAAGDLHGPQTEVLSFCAIPTVQGTFDAICELVGKEGISAPSISVCRINLRVHVVLTLVGGVPETYDFGSCVVGSVQTHSFMVENIGSSAVQIALISRTPFDVAPGVFTLAIAGQQLVTLTYSPTESSKDSMYKIPCFINHTVHTVRVFGKSGFVELTSNNSRNLLDFGSVSSNCISWMNLYLTNRGTLPIRLDHVIATHPEFLTLELVGKQLLVHSSSFLVQKDYWLIVKSKLKALSLIGHFLRHKLKAIPTRPAEEQKNDQDDGMGIVKAKIIPTTATRNTAYKARRNLRIPITKDKTHNLVDILGDTNQLVVLDPMQSFWLRLGFSTAHQTRQTTDLRFCYTPVLSSGSSSHMKELTFTATGYIYRVLDFHPNVIEFGLVPVTLTSTSLRSIFTESGNDTTANEGEISCNEFNTRYLLINNLSIETQSASLLLSTSSGPKKPESRLPARINEKSGAESSIVPHERMRAGTTTSFRLEGRTWVLGPGESARVPVRFVPSKSQMQYQGEALFQHSHGVSIIRFSGTGASAEVSHPRLLHFGAVSMNKAGRALFAVVNKGLLSATVHLQMTDTDVFTFERDDPYDNELEVEPGSQMDVPIRCLCTRQIPTIKSSMYVAWRRSPIEPWESNEVTLTVDVGYPMFSVDLMELDFGVTYVKKTLEIRIRNDGNAPCSWSINPNIDLAFSTAQGQLAPVSSSVLEVTFQPKTFEPLESNVDFATDVGLKTVLAYGIVGVPYLKIPDEHTLMDFGIIDIEHEHSQQLPFANTGTKQIEFVIELSQNDSVFSVSPDKGFIDPASELAITVTARPRVFAKVTNCSWCVKTKDGERYDGSFACVGGQAIVVMSKLFEMTSLARLGPRRQSTPSVVGSQDLSAGSRKSLDALNKVEPDAQTDSSKRFTAQAYLAFQEHVKTLKGITIDLTSDYSKELEFSIRQIDESRRLKSRSGSVLSRPTTRSALISTPGAMIGTPATASSGIAKPGSPLANPLPPISADAGISTPASRPGTQSSAKIRWLEGTLFNLKDVQKPIADLLSKSENLFRRLQNTREDDTIVRASLTSVAETLPKPKRTSEMPSAAEDEQKRSKSSPGESASYAKPVTPNEIQRHVEESKRAMEMIQQHIQHVTDSKAVHLLEKATDTLLNTTRRLEQTIYTDASKQNEPQAAGSTAESPVKVFDLGVIRGTSMIDKEVLFDLPNLGNMAFEFELEVSPESMTKFFQISPLKSEIMPGTSIPIVVTFKAKESGIYRMDCALKSKGQSQLAFVVKVGVGNPKIEVQTTKFDFGLHLVGTTLTLPCKIMNTGTYKDTVEFSLTGNVFILETERRVCRLAAGGDMAIPICFAPKVEGEFSGILMIVPSAQPPIELTLQGMGGRPKLQVLQTKIPFGQIFTGASRTISCPVTNFGNWKAELLPRLTHPNFNLYIGGRAVFPGDVHEVGVGETLTYDITLSSEVTTDAAARLVFEEQLLHERIEVSITGYAGAFAVESAGDIVFDNLKVEDLHSSVVSYQNLGDFICSVTYKLEPTSLAENFTVTIDGTPAAGSIEIPPASNITLSLNACPRMAMQIAGKFSVLVKAFAGDDSREKLYEYDFNFRAFDQPLIIDRLEDGTDIGVLAVGKTEEWSCNVINYDARPAKIRVRLEPILPVPADDVKEVKELKDAKKKIKKGKKKPKEVEKEEKKQPLAESYVMCWTIDALDFDIGTGNAESIRATFLASDAANAIQEATALVEYSMDGGVTYALLHKYHLKGNSGRPHLQLSMPFIDFGYVPCGVAVVQDVVLKNTGTARSDWTLEPGWNNDDIFTVQNCESEMVTPPGEESRLQIQFLASVTFEFSSEITIKADPEILKFGLHGQGCVSRIYSAGLPKEISLNGDINGKAVSTTFSVCNDCVFIVPLELFVNCLSGEAFQTHLQLRPRELTLLANASTSVSPGEREHLEVQVELASIFTSSAGEIEQLLDNGIDYIVSLKSSVFVEEFSFPVHVSYYYSKPEVSALSVQFGDVKYDSTKSIVVQVRNDNPFDVPLSIASTHDLFNGHSDLPYLLANSTTDIAITLVPQVYSVEADIPLLLEVNGNLRLDYLNSKDVDVISISGRFIDRQEPPQFCDIDFGSMFVSTTVTKIFTLCNWLRKPLDYQMMFPDNFKAIIEVESNQLKGSIPARGARDIPMQISPRSVSFLSIPISLVTNGGSFAFNCNGQGVGVSVELEQTEIYFGIVGIGHGEGRSINLKNMSTLSIPLTFQVVTSSDAAIDESGKPILNPEDLCTIFPVQEELFVKENSTATLPISFYPKEGIIGTQSGILEVIALNKIIGTCRLAGEAGKLSVVCDTSGKIVFSGVEVMDMKSTDVVFQNNGNVSVTLTFADEEGRPITRGKEVASKQHVASFGCKPQSATLASGQTTKFKISATGMRGGSDTCQLAFITPQLIQPIKFTFDVEVQVIAAEGMRPIKQFAKADATIETKLTTELPEGPSYKSDEGIWKVLLPIVKIDLQTPGTKDNHISVPRVEPRTPLPSIMQLLMRPAALPTANLPKDLEKQTSSKLAIQARSTSGRAKADQYPRRDPAADIVPAVIEREMRRREALKMLSPIERSIFAITKEKKRDRYK